MIDYLEELSKKQNVIQLVRNQVYHLKTKHKKQYNFTRKLVEDGDVFGEERECKESSKHIEKMCYVGKLGLFKASIVIKM